MKNGRYSISISGTVTRGFWSEGKVEDVGVVETEGDEGDEGDEEEDTGG